MLRISLYCGVLALLLMATAGHTEPGISKTAIKLGQTTSLTGPIAADGLGHLDGVKAYFAEVNERGGIFGRKIELVSYDDGFDPKRASENAKKLVEQDQVFALFEVLGTPTALEAYKVAAPLEVPMIAPVSGFPGFRDAEKFPLLYSARSTYAEEVQAIIRQLISVGITKIGIVFQNDPFGIPVSEIGTRYMEQEFKLKPVATAPIDRTGKDAHEAAAIITAAQPQAVILLTTTKPAGAVMAELRKGGLAPTFMGMSPLSAEIITKDVGEAVTRGLGITQIVPSPGNISIPVIKELQTLLTKHAKLTPTYYNTEGFINAKIMVEALRRAGPDPTRKKLIAALNSGTPIDVGGFSVRYLPDKKIGSTFVELTVVSRGGKVMR